MSDYFATPWTVAHQAPLSMGFSRQECWSGLPFPSPGTLLNPEIESISPASEGWFFTTLPPVPPSSVFSPWLWPTSALPALTSSQPSCCPLLLPWPWSVLPAPSCASSLSPPPPPLAPLLSNILSLSPGPLPLLSSASPFCSSFTSAPPLLSGCLLPGHLS